MNRPALYSNSRPKSAIETQGLLSDVKPVSHSLHFTFYVESAQLALGWISERIEYGKVF